MSRMKRSASVCLLGDLVGSRQAADRRDVHVRLVAALSEANERWDCDLRVVAGDEFQGVVPSLGVAATLSLTLRLALLPDSDLRFGIGRGEVTMLDERTGIQDGPGWWAARAAIEVVERLERSSATRTARAAFRATDPDPGEPAVGAALLARDALVGRMDPRALSVLRGLLAGRTQQEIAMAEGVSASAVSQRVRHDGLGVVLAVTEMLGGLP